MSESSVQTISLREEPERWRRFHSSVPGATVFSSHPWLCTLADQFQRDPVAVLLLRGDDIVAGIPLLLRRRFLLRTAPPLPITMYAGLLTVPDHRLWQGDFSLLLGAVERRCHYVALSANFSDDVCEMFTSRQWSAQSRLNRCIPLRSSEDLWEGYSQSLRRKIRRASESDLRLDTDPTAQTLAECYGESYHRHGIQPPIPAEHIQRWLADLQRKNMVEMFAARRADGRCVATRALIRDGDTLFDWLAGANPPLAPNGSHWLLHILLTRYLEAGCSRFDFMGANTPGVSDFKRSFGGSHYSYHELEWYRPALLKHVNALRSRQRQRQRGMT